MIETQVVSTTRVLELAGVRMFAFSRRFGCVLENFQGSNRFVKLNLYNVKERGCTSQKYLDVKKGMTSIE